MLEGSSPVKLGLLASVLVAVACVSTIAPAAWAQAPQNNEVPRCEVEVTGPSGRNYEVEQVAAVLLKRGCIEGTAIRLLNIQPLRDVTNGGFAGGGRHFATLLCRQLSARIEGPPEGVQSVTCFYSGSDARGSDASILRR